MSAEAVDPLDDVTEHAARKPDPDEPWRYVCPDCEGQVHGDDDTNNYTCVRCGGIFPAAILFDKATERYGVSFQR